MTTQINPLPTTLTVSYGASSTDVVAIPAGLPYDQMVNNWFKGGGYWGGANGATFIPWPQIKTIVAS